MRAFVEHFFDIKRHHSSIRTECLAGLTTFSTMAYIVVVNPLVLASAGMDYAAVMVATILSAALSTLIMGLAANYPFALAPGMGINAYFTYTLVLGMHVPWQTALGACFLAGLLFVLLTLSGLRQSIMAALPESLRVTLSSGIGFFLAFIGLKNVGAIVPNPSTFVALGDITQPQVLLTGLGVVMIAALMSRGVTGAILITLIVLWALGLLFGLAQWQGIVSWPPSMSATWLQLDVPSALQPEFWGITLAFLFIAIFDATGSLTALSHQGKFVLRTNRVFYADSIGTTVGALLGTSTISTYLESGAGIASGGRTGLTAVVVALLFLVALFFSPFVSSIPHFATAPALIVVGALMMRSLSQLSWDDPSDYIPGFIVLVSVPLTFSLATGIALGLILHPVVKLLCGRHREVPWLSWVLGVLSVFKFAVVG